jgi:hypothetical protein
MQQFEKTSTRMATGNVGLIVGGLKGVSRRGLFERDVRGPKSRRSNGSCHGELRLDRPKHAFVIQLLFAASAIATIGCSGNDGYQLGIDAGSAQDAAGFDSGKDAASEAASSDGGAIAACARKTCAQIGANCGSAPDGCGGKIECGQCEIGLTCGAGGQNVCGQGECSPKSCVTVGAQCGIASDGCSKAIDCGTCALPDTCGATAQANMCGCIPKTCGQLGAACGTIPDGCRGVIDCGACKNGQTCGGGGPNQCGYSQCAPKGCAQLGASCGYVSDGCSKAIDCGECDGTSQCGGGGVVNQCGCPPKSCFQMGASCGAVDTGCAQIDCGSCPAPNSCGGGGVPNQCGCSCTLPNADAQCSDGGCAIAQCKAGWTDCNGSSADGCEVQESSDPSNCGACGKSCKYSNASAKCVTASCQIDKCTSGFGNCDGQEDTGCETDLTTSKANCGSCSRACGGQCVGGQCEVTSAETSRKWDASYKGSGSPYTHRR